MRTTFESSSYAEVAPGAERAATPLRHREVICLFGLPIDVIRLDGAVQRVAQAIRSRQRCVVSTPNVNFVVAAQKSVEFRRSIQLSQLVLADGSPIVWVSRLLGAPLPERASGADLFDTLRHRQPEASRQPVKVYFFGGQPGAAKEACESLGQGREDVAAGVGFDEAGFGSVDEIGSAASLDKINASRADFLVVSLGAVKGQSWILRNQARLRTPVISHLGAVVNFVSGRVSRAPRWMQRAHLEWLYRIWQEPMLWRRYGSDGVKIMMLALTQLLPYLVLHHGLEVFRAFFAPKSSRVSAHWEISAFGHCLVLQGDHRQHHLAPLRVALDKMPTDGRIEVDCSALKGLDLYALGLLISKFGVHDAQDFEFTGMRWSIRQLVRFAGAGYLLKKG